MESEIKFIPDSEHLVQELSNLFKRRGRENNYKTKFEMKNGAHLTQQKKRLIAIQLQEPVDTKFKILIQQGHIEEVVDTITNDDFIQLIDYNCEKGPVCQNCARRTSTE